MVVAHGDLLSLLKTDRAKGKGYLPAGWSGVGRAG